MSWRFKVVSVGWNCAQFIDRTLASIDTQTDTEYDLFIVDDATQDPDQHSIIERWCSTRSNWHYQLNPEHKWALRNQVEAIEALVTEAEDVIVWLDLDGDQFAHPGVLAHLRSIYDGEHCSMTYGNYQSVPDPGTTPVCDSFPDAVVASNTFRQEILGGGLCHFNHLRTMKGFIYKNIPPSYFRFEGTDRWLEGGTDYAFMVPALELSGRRYRFIPEVLCLYNHANPYADNVHRSMESTASVLDSLRRPPLQPMAGREVREPVPSSDLFMSSDMRRRLLRETGDRWALHNFVETGTSTGETTDFLQAHFFALHTIELHEPVYRAYHDRINPHSNITTWLGDSSVVLPTVLGQLDGPALFWLDGHYCGPGSGRGSVDSPVRVELEIVMADTATRKHVILVDDARIFGGGPEEGMEGYSGYPHLSWVAELAAVCGYSYELADDVIRLTPK